MNNGAGGDLHFIGRRCNYLEPTACRDISDMVPAQRLALPVAVAQHAKVATAADRGRSRRAGRRSKGTLHRWPGRLANGVGERQQVVKTGTGLIGYIGQPHDLPPARSSEPLTVDGAQVVAVRLGVGGERPQHSGGVGVHVRQRRHGGAVAGGAAAPTDTHTSGRYLPPPTPVGIRALSAPVSGQVRRRWSLD